MAIVSDNGQATTTFTVKSPSVMESVQSNPMILWLVIGLAVVIVLVIVIAVCVQKKKR